MGTRLAQSVIETVLSRLRAAHGCGWNAEETADSGSAGVMEEVRFELAFELKAGVFICCFV